MYKMTAAHPTLPIPSYARITSLETGKQVVVRINDRGPFHSNRLIDVSYTAALKLGLLGKGSNQVQVDRIMAPDPARIATLRREANAEAATAPAEITTLMLEDRMAIESAALVAPPAPAVAAAPVYRAVPSGPSVAVPVSASPMQALPVSASPVPSEPVAARNGYYLQLGAYGRAGGADDVRTRLAAAGIDNASLDVVQAGSVYRLFRGPFATRSEAEAAMHDLPTALALKPLIIKR
jgi:rare lipoprotein A